MPTRVTVMPAARAASSRAGSRARRNRQQKFVVVPAGQACPNQSGPAECAGSDSGTNVASISAAKLLARQR